MLKKSLSLLAGVFLIASITSCNKFKKTDSGLEYQIAKDSTGEVYPEKGGFITAHWDCTAETEEKIKESTKATIRCIPLNNKPEGGKCILTGKPSMQRVLFARAY